MSGWGQNAEVRIKVLWTLSVVLKDTQVSVNGSLQFISAPGRDGVGKSAFPLQICRMPRCLPSLTEQGGRGKGLGPCSWGTALSRAQGFRCRGQRCPEMPRPEANTRSPTTTPCSAGSSASLPAARALTPRRAGQPEPVDSGQDRGVQA